MISAVTPLAAWDGRALGTTIRVVVTRGDRLVAARTAVEASLADLDAACSRFRDDSELSRLNAAAGREVAIGPLLAAALSAALRGAELTEGDVDPTIGGALRLAGYDRDFAEVRDDRASLLTVARVPGWRTVRLNRVAGSAMVPVGVELDLGATAKALGADLAAAAAHSAAGAGVLVSLGGDIALAGEPPQRGWTIAVSENSGDPVELAGEAILLSGGGVATSSTRVRRWRRGGAELHHIIDPRTGRPSDGPWCLATVVADSCVDANIASTAAIVRGRGAVAWLEALGLPARLVADDGTVVRTLGWPDPGGLAGDAR